MNLMNWYRRITNSIRHLLYVDKCPVCDEVLMGVERGICNSCFYNMPRTSHITNFAVLEPHFAGKTLIDKSTSYFLYSKDSDYSRIIKRIKYAGEPHIAYELAYKFALELLPTGFFNGIDYVVPIPTHPYRKFIRDYDQTEFIAKGISAATSKETLLILSPNIFVPTHQAGKNFEQRTNSYAHKPKFRLKSGIDLSGKHILLVDDVITTGATLTDGVKALRHNNSVIVSILTLALDRLE